MLSAAFPSIYRGLFVLKITPDHLQQGEKLRAWSVHQPEKSPLLLTFIYIVRAPQKNNLSAHWVFSSQLISDFMYLVVSSHIKVLLKPEASKGGETTHQLVETETAEQSRLAASSGRLEKQQLMDLLLPISKC